MIVSKPINNISIILMKIIHSLSYILLSESTLALSI